MYRNIVLAYDGTANGAEALKQGVEIAGLCKANLHLLGIVVTTGAAALAQSAGAYDVYETERKFIERTLETAVRELEEQGVKATTTIRDGDPANEILAFTHETKADLVVLGHRDQSVLARWFQGSVGARLLSNLPCSLLIATKK